MRRMWLGGRVDAAGFPPSCRTLICDFELAVYKH